MKILITGVAGFIGMHTAKYFLEKGVEVVGIDNLNNYYDIDLKKARLSNLKRNKNSKNFTFKELDLVIKKDLSSLFKNTILMEQ